MSADAEVLKETGSHARGDGATREAGSSQSHAESFDAAPAARAPSVSVVIPCYNEERFIGRVLENLAPQYDAARYELVVVDGMSTDGTRAAVEQFRRAAKNLEVRVVENPARHIPVALNLGFEAARGEIVVRMDAHSVPSPNYVRRCVEVLGSGAAEIVGMPWRIRPGAETVVARAVALAVAHPFGIGDAKYRTTRAGTNTQTAVDTVPFGALRRELWRELGGYNESLLANEDYDFNYRARQRGARVVLDTSAHSDYFARPTLAALASQYARYGRWKAQMLRLHPRSARMRQLVAPAFVAALVVSLVAGFVWRPAWWLFAAALGSYALAALLCAALIARRARSLRIFFVLPLVFFMIHVSWGASFLLGLGARARRAPEV